MEKIWIRRLRRKRALKHQTLEALEEAGLAPFCDPASGSSAVRRRVDDGRASWVRHGLGRTAAKVLGRGAAGFRFEAASSNKRGYGDKGEAAR